MVGALDNPDKIAYDVGEVGAEAEGEAEGGGVSTLVGAKPILWSSIKGGLRRPWKTYDVGYVPKTSMGLSNCGHYVVMAYDAEGNLQGGIDLPEPLVEALVAAHIPKALREQS